MAITPMNVRFAEMVLLAMKTREQSYDKNAAEAATKKADAERKANPGNHYCGIVDYRKFYRKTFEQAAEEAAARYDEPKMAYPIYLMMVTAQNDIELWARENLQ